MVMYMYDDDDEFYPKVGEIAGFELCGWKVEGGIILGADKEKGRFIKKFPALVHICGMNYTFEEEKWQDNGFGWGMYA